MSNICNLFNINSTALPSISFQEATTLPEHNAPIADGLKVSIMKLHSIQSNTPMNFSFEHHTENKKWGSRLLTHIAFAVSTLFLGFLLRLLISPTYRTSLWCAVWNQKLVVTTLRPSSSEATTPVEKANESIRRIASYKTLPGSPLADDKEERRRSLPSPRTLQSIAADADRASLRATTSSESSASSSPASSESSTPEDASDSLPTTGVPPLLLPAATASSARDRARALMMVSIGPDHAFFKERDPEGDKEAERALAAVVATRRAAREKTAADAASTSTFTAVKSPDKNPYGHIRLRATVVNAHKK